MESEQTQSGKFLSFILDRENFAVPILCVREIIAMHSITPLPRLDPEIRGVINLRGKIIPVVDLRMKLGLVTADYDRSTCIVVFDVELEEGSQGNVGCIVNGVREVVSLSLEKIQPPPNVLGHSGSDFIQGLCKLEGSDSVMSILDMDRLLASLTIRSAMLEPVGAGE